MSRVTRVSTRSRLRRHRHNKYLLETTGTGVALFDYDNDGRLDLFFVNGTTLERLSAGPGADQSSLSERATARSRT